MPVVPNSSPRLVITWICNCLALLAAAAIVPAISYGNDFGTLVFAGAILGVANFVLRPLVILLALPAVVLSLGIALLFINALMLWITSLIVPRLYVGGFWSTVGGALVIWAVNLVLRPSKRPRRATLEVHRTTGRTRY
jgi:putative membrane protein